MPTYDKYGYLDWAKTKSPTDVLAHSSVHASTIQDAVTEGYGCEEFLSSIDSAHNQWGLPGLKKAIAIRYGIEDSEQEPRVLLTPGASNAIYDVCETFLQAGDEAIVETPNYEPLHDAARRTGAQVIPWKRNDLDFSLNLTALSEVINPQKTKLIILSNLHNPSSQLTPYEELRQVADIVRASGCSSQTRIVVDEVYRGLAPEFSSEKVDSQPTPGSEASSAVQLGDEFISINSLSKVYGLSRLRCGWILGPPEVIQRIRSTYKLVMNIGSLDNELMSAIVFSDLKEYTPQSKQIVSTNREILVNELARLLGTGILSGKIPQFGCTYFPKLPWLDRSKDHNAVDTVIHLLDKECGVVPGSFFGKEYYSHVRIGFGGPRDKFRTAIQEFRRKLENVHEMIVKGVSR